MMRRTLMLTASLLLTAVLVTPAMACPFCAAVSQTFREEIASMDAVVIARLVELPPAAQGRDAADVSGEVAKARFEIEEVLKGQAFLKGKSQVQTIYFGDGQLGRSFLIMGVDPPNLMWSTPLQLSDRAKQYLSQVMKLPDNGLKRLQFFQQYLEDADEMLARDAYDEFAKSPYDEVKQLKPHMDHDQLVAWIKNPDIPASRRRLYLTMLGVCGGPEDAAMLEEMLQSDDRKMKSGLDAMIGCYLTLKGADGMPLVEELYLKNKDAEYADTYAAIMALRFHGTEADVVPRERILQAMHYMLERPQLADLVIPDLARWEDWSQMERLVKLFKEADEKSSWVRVPVVNYLRACPLPASQRYIKELEKVDPEAVKRANTFFPFGAGGAAPAGDEKSSAAEPAEKPQPVIALAPPRGAAVAAAKPLRPAGRGALTAQATPNQIGLVSVFWLGAAAMLLVLWRVLCGAGSPVHVRS